MSDPFEFDNPELADSVTKAHVAEDGMEAGERLDELADELVDAYGPQSAEEEAEAGAEAAKARALEAEHGKDYHGFGHPPDPKN